MKFLHSLDIPPDVRNTRGVKFSFYTLRGQGGVPWVQIMENEFECLVVRRGDGGHFAEKFVKKYCS